MSNNSEPAYTYNYGLEPTKVKLKIADDFSELFYILLFGPDLKDLKDLEIKPAWHKDVAFVAFLIKHLATKSHNTKLLENQDPI